MSNILRIKTPGGEIEVDISKEACSMFGFLYGDKAITPFGDEVTIVGVAPAPESSKIARQKVLWYEKKDGFAYYYCGYGSTNLKELGFEAKLD